MAYEVHKRIFGSRIPQSVQDKLNLRQLLGESKSNLDPSESIEEKYGYIANFDGDADLSSRTPFARLWTSVDLIHYEYDNPANTKVLTGETVIGNQIYVVGNNVYNNMPLNPNEPLYQERAQGRYGSGGFNNNLKKAFPLEMESDDNVFNTPPVGIKSITSQTEGMGAVKKTTVNFKVYNYADYENIYLRYFLRPGAIMFVDFGWDTNTLYDPADVVADPDKVNDKLYGQSGYVTRSGGDLEVLQGTVTNYTSKAQDDGSIDISLDIHSAGTSLVSKDMSKGENAKIRRRIAFGLDQQIMLHLEQLGYVDNLYGGPNGDVNKNWKSSEKFSQIAAKQGMGTPLGAGNAPGKDSVVGTFHQTQRAKGWYNFPSMQSQEAGVYFAPTNGKARTEACMFISIGLFEDLILNHEFGFGDDHEDVLNGENSLRFDSSNHFMRFTDRLEKRQSAISDASKISYLYPKKWETTYNTIVGKSPDYPDNFETYQEFLKGRAEFVVKVQKDMTDDQKAESIMQWEENKWGHQTMDPSFDLQKGQHKRAPYYTKGEPYCINLGGADNLGFERGQEYRLSPGRPSGQLSYQPMSYHNCGQHGRGINKGHDYFVPSSTFKCGHHDGWPGAGSCRGPDDYPNAAILQPYSESEIKHYDADEDGDIIDVTLHTTVPYLNFEAGETVKGGNLGYVEHTEEDVGQLALSNYLLDKGLQRIPVRDLFVNVAVIKKAFINNTKLTDAMKEVCKTIKEDSGGIIDLNFASNDYSNTKMALIDKNWVESELGIYNSEYFMFNINSRSTLVKSFDIEYKIPSDDFSAALAIQTMAGQELVPTDVTMDYILSDKLLYQAEDASSYGLRYKPYLGNYQAMKLQSYKGDAVEAMSYNPFDSSTVQTDSVKQWYDKLIAGRTATNPTGVKANITATTWKNTKTKSGQSLPADNADGVATEEGAMKVDDAILSLENLTDNKVLTKDTEEYYLEHAKREFFYHVSSTLLPFEVNLRIVGISSLMVGDTFQVSYLPERYRKLAYFQITGISHNVENTGWTTEITSHMRMRSDVKKDSNYTVTVIAQNVRTRDDRKNTPYGSGVSTLQLGQEHITSATTGAQIVIDPKQYFSVNFEGMVNPHIKKLGIKNFTDMLPLDEPFTDAHRSYIHEDNILKFTWNGPTREFSQTRIVAAMSEMGFSPDQTVANMRWDAILKNKPLIKASNPNLEYFDTYGDISPWINDKREMGTKCCFMRTWNSEGWLKGTLNSHRIKDYWEVDEGANFVKWVQDQRSYGSNNHVDNYWVVRYRTNLIAGAEYLMFGSPGFGDVAIFPIETDKAALYTILPIIYPLEGQPLNGYSMTGTTTMWYRKYASGIEHVKQDEPPKSKSSSPPSQKRYHQGGFEPVAPDDVPQ